VLSQSINDRLWTSFWYKKHNVSGFTPYRFDTIDDPRQKGFSVGYILTPRDTIIFSLAKNLDSGDISDRNYTWVRDLHSFTAIITYKEVEDEWDLEVIPKDFRF
jgi:LPS-assembly protein